MSLPDLRWLVAPVAIAAAAVGVTIPIASDDRPIAAQYETAALFDDEAGGDANADDPAIWAHPDDRARSLIVAAVKNGGLLV